MGFEPTTFSLATRCSTAELHPHQTIGVAFNPSLEARGHHHAPATRGLWKSSFYSLGHYAEPATGVKHPYLPFGVSSPAFIRPASLADHLTPSKKHVEEGPRPLYGRS